MTLIDPNLSYLFMNVFMSVFMMQSLLFIDLIFLGKWSTFHKNNMCMLYLNYHA